MVADRPSQDGVLRFERVEDGANRGGAVHAKLDFVADARQRPKVVREHDANHWSVCASTESTAGRSRTMGVHVSPASAEPYTWPPVVPK